MIQIFDPKIYTDSRGWFYESFNEESFPIKFVQDNHSFSYRNVLRGLHYQIEKPQGKLVRCIRGQVLDVSVDLRINSATYGQVFYVILSDKNKRSVYIPEGFAHGFYTLDEENIVFYSCSNYRNKNSETGILWNDKDININWPTKNPILSKKDKKNLSLKEYSRKFFL